MRLGRFIHFIVQRSKSVAWLMVCVGILSGLLSAGVLALINHVLHHPSDHSLLLLFGFIALVGIISMYGAMAVFLLYYLRFLGRHSWSLTLILTTSLPIGFFFFFEGLMRVTLPKGMQFTEPFFNILYNIIY